VRGGGGGVCVFVRACPLVCVCARARAVVSLQQQKEFFFILCFAEPAQIPALQAAKTMAFTLSHSFILTP